VDALELIRSVVEEEARGLGIGVERVVLLGSRVRGDWDEESDWDILLVVEPGVERRVLRRLQYRVYRALGDHGIYADVLVVPGDRLVRYGSDPGLIYNVALREGVDVELELEDLVDQLREGAPLNVSREDLSRERIYGERLRRIILERWRRTGRRARLGELENVSLEDEFEDEEQV